MIFSIYYKGLKNIIYKRNNFVIFISRYLHLVIRRSILFSQNVLFKMSITLNNGVLKSLDGPYPT